jgi:carboxyl-terminal processing protease
LAIGCAVRLLLALAAAAHATSVMAAPPPAAPTAPVPDQLTPEQVQKVREAHQATLAGVGALLGKTPAGELVVSEVISDGPAGRAGIRAGQIIRSINGAPAATLRLEDAAKLIRGPAGSTVELELVEPGHAAAAPPRRLKLVREQLVVGIDYRLLDGHVALLALTGFTDRTAPRVRQILDWFGLQGVHGVVLDLRHSTPSDNYVSQRDVAGYFVGDSTALWLERSGDETYARPVQSTARQIWTGPVVVLIDETTRQSAQLLAYALQANGRARLLGRPTAGAAAMMNLENQPDGSVRRGAVTHFFTLRDEPINGGSVKPDLALAATLPAEEVLARASTELAHAPDRPVAARLAAPPPPPAAAAAQAQGPDVARRASGDDEAFCQRGDARACKAMAVRYGVVRNPQQSNPYLRRACDLRDTEACATLAESYERGRGVPTDYAMAAKLYEWACSAGYGDACSSLGQMTQDGRGSPKNVNQAEAYFDRGCELGSGVACTNAGVSALTQHTWEIWDFSHRGKATAYYQKACDLGEPTGCTNLAAYYEDSDAPADRAKAEAYYDRACRLGRELACTERDRLAKDVHIYIHRRH